MYVPNTKACSLKSDRLTYHSVLVSNSKWWLLLQSKHEEVEKAVGYAIKAGYRHIDTARIYGNEGEIGSALEKANMEGLVKREDMYITTKASASRKYLRQNIPSPPPMKITGNIYSFCFCAIMLEEHIFISPAPCQPFFLCLTIGIFTKEILIFSS